jgi:hypothetical protein
MTSIVARHTRRRCGAITGAGPTKARPPPPGRHCRCPQRQGGASSKRSAFVARRTTSTTSSSRAHGAASTCTRCCTASTGPPANVERTSHGRRDRRTARRA